MHLQTRLEEEHQAYSACIHKLHDFAAHNQPNAAAAFRAAVEASTREGRASNACRVFVKDYWRRGEAFFFFLPLFPPHFHFHFTAAFRAIACAPAKKQEPWVLELEGRHRRFKDIVEPLDGDGDSATDTYVYTFPKV